MRKPLFFLFTACVIASCSSALSSSTEADASAIAKQIDVFYQVDSNVGQVNCDTPANFGKCFSARVTYRAGALGVPSNTVIYFSHISPIQSTSRNDVKIEHLQGDFHKLTFANGIEKNSEVTFEILAPFWHAARSDVMPNQYLTIGDSEPAIISSTQRQIEQGSGISYSPHAGNWQLPQQYKRNANDQLALETTDYIYEQLPEAWSPQANVRVIPQVNQRQDSTNRRPFSGIAPAALKPYLSDDMLAQIEVVGLLSNDNPEEIAISIDAQHFDSVSGYQLTVSDDITISAASQVALGYALTTLSQLLDSDGQVIMTKIIDSPRFALRGVHLDVARHFLGEQAIETLLEQMFQLKLNTLHLHLSDDEGWRVEIPQLPELTDIGAYRCHDLSETRCILPQLGSGPHRDAQGNGFLSVEQYQRLLKKAQALGIEIIPSFDMPGHARAAVKAMEARYKKYFALGELDAAKAYLLSDPNDRTRYASVQFYNDNTMNPCIESSYRFVETVLKSIIQTHREAGVPLKTYHLGADETAGAWVNSPICVAMGEDPERLRSKFVGRVIEIGNRLGLTMAGWSDGMEDTLEQIAGKRVQVNIWDTLYGNGTQKVSEFLAHKIPTILSFPDILYFDFPYRNHPNEPGYYWASKSTSTQRVFEFMPGNLPAHADLWKDRFGQNYIDSHVAPDASALLGIQAQLWTEVTPNQAHMEYMLFPRLLAFAERAWSYPQWQDDFGQREWFVSREQDWQNFAKSMVVTQFPRLDKAKINYRVPLPGTKWQENRLTLKASLPGLISEFSQDGKSWSLYIAPIAIDGPVWVRARVPNSDATSAHIKLQN